MVGISCAAHSRIAGRRRRQRGRPDVSSRRPSRQTRQLREVLEQARDSLRKQQLCEDSLVSRCAGQCGIEIGRRKNADTRGRGKVCAKQDTPERPADAPVHESRQ